MAYNMDELIAFIKNRRHFAQDDYERRRYTEVLEELYRIKDLED
jgi:hypothetical protein